VGSKITVKNTLWVFVSSSQEPRHLHDVAFAIDSLRYRGVSERDILVFVDHPTPQQYLAPYGIEALFRLEHLLPRLSASAGYEHVFATVAGHGNISGLGPGPVPSVRPNELLKGIRSVAGAGHATLLLSQCYAGIFNLLDATAKPEIVTIGATSLNPSLSMTIELDRPLKQRNGEQGIARWSANLFMLAFFNWLRHPTDVDGDGLMSLVDAYKHAGAATNEQLRSAKARLFMQIRKIGEELERARSGAESGLAVEAIELKLGRSLENLYLHQEPWLLHANLARKIEF